MPTTKLQDATAAYNTYLSVKNAFDAVRLAYVTLGNTSATYVQEALDALDKVRGDLSLKRTLALRELYNAMDKLDPETAEAFAAIASL